MSVHRCRLIDRARSKPIDKEIVAPPIIEAVLASGQVSSSVPFVPDSVWERMRIAVERERVLREAALAGCALAGQEKILEGARTSSGPMRT